MLTKQKHFWIAETCKKVADVMLRAGVQWARKRNIPEERGVMAFLELVASGDVLVYEENNEIMFSLPEIEEKRLREADVSGHA